MNSPAFEISYDPQTGGIRSLVNPADPCRMNWVEGHAVWGVVHGSKLVSCETLEDGLQAVYQTPHLTVTATRRATGKALCETYVFRNRLNADVFISRGAAGTKRTGKEPSKEPGTSFACSVRTIRAQPVSCTPFRSTAPGANISTRTPTNKTDICII